MLSKISEVSQLLIDARQSQTHIRRLPDNLVPINVEEAYAVQDAIVDREGSYGWKVGFPKDGQERRCAPLAGSSLYSAPCQISSAKLGADSLEVEIALVLSLGLPPRTERYTASDVKSAIGAAHLAFEFVASRFEDRKAISPLTAIADCQSNGATVLAEAIPDWKSIDYSNLGIRLLADSQQIAACPGGASLADMLEQVAWLANHAIDRKRPLKRGAVIITGARIGPLPLPREGILEARADGFPTLALTLNAN